jgi:hypothetical protein
MIINQLYFEGPIAPVSITFQRFMASFIVVAAGRKSTFLCLATRVVGTRYSVRASGALHGARANWHAPRSYNQPLARPLSAKSVPGFRQPPIPFIPGGKAWPFSDQPPTAVFSPAQGGQK